MAGMARILFVDDVADWRRLLIGLLCDHGYEVKAVESREKAQQALKEESFVLAILDKRLDETDERDAEGLMLARYISDNYPQMPVIILTGYGTQEDIALAQKLDTRGRRLAAAFLEKAHLDELPGVLAEIVRPQIVRPLRPLFSTPQDVCTLTLSLEPKQRILVRARGLDTFTHNSANPLSIEPAVYSRYADNIRQTYDWRFDSKEIGKQLYKKIFEEHKEVLIGYHRLLGKVKKEYLLHLCFESSRDFLRVPLEFAFDPDPGEYLALKHPLSRFVEGVHAGRPPLSPEFLNDLWDRREALKVLLIASNTKPRIDGVDEEIKALVLSLRKAKEGVGVLCQLKHIPTEQATYERVKEELRECKYHIIHYAGHGRYNDQSPEKSSLFFWEKENCQGKIKPMTASTLKLLLENSDVSFIYLSCCSGSKSGDSVQLLDDDFLGIADGVIYAGVPAVLGFRWPVSDKSAKQLALAFYKSLLRQGNLDLALLHARREVAIPNKDDPTWISPILIVQR